MVLTRFGRQRRASRTEQPENRHIIAKIGGSHQGPPWRTRPESSEKRFRPRHLIAKHDEPFTSACGARLARTNGRRHNRDIDIRRSVGLRTRADGYALGSADSDATFSNHSGFCLLRHGRLEIGRHVRWDWEMYDMSIHVTAQAIEPNNALFPCGQDTADPRRSNERSRPRRTARRSSASHSPASPETATNS